MTNGLVFDPVQVTQQLQSLPPSWIPWVNAALLVLMILGRFAAGSITGSQNPLKALVSAFTGSVHTATTTSVAAQSVPTTTAVVAAPVKPVPVVTTPVVVPPTPVPTTLTPEQTAAIQSVHAASAALAPLSPPLPPKT